MTEHTDIPPVLQVAATELRQLYLSLIGVGFTEPQALMLIGQMLAANKK